MKHLYLVSIVFIALGCAKLLAGRPSKVKPDGSEYFGREVADPFSWMEEAKLPRLEEWIEAENEKTSRYLGSLPFISRLHERVIEIAKTNPASYSALHWHAGRLFALKTQPPLARPLLVVMPSADEPEQEEVIVDPNLIDRTGALSIDWFVPSPDGELVAVSMSVAGDDVGDLSLYPVDREYRPKGRRRGAKNKGRRRAKAAADNPGTQREPVDVLIPRVSAPTAGGSLAWAPDSTGFYYTRYPREGEQPPPDMMCCEQLYYHKLGTPARKDEYMLGEDLGRTDRITVTVDDRSGRVLAAVKRDDNGHVSHFLKERGGGWQQLSRFDDGVVAVTFAPAGGMFLISRRDAPRGRLLYLSSPKVTVGKARKVIPESEDSIVSDSPDGETMVVTDLVIYLTYQTGGPSEIRAFNHRGEPMEGPSLPPGTGIGEIAPLGEGEIIFSAHSYTSPTAWYTYDARIGQGSLEAKRLSTVFGVDFQDAEVERVAVDAPDGAKVPLTIVRPRSLVKDGDRPTLLTGFGSFGRSLTPRFNPLSRIWLDHGGVLAFAHVRGGGELGDGWHRAGAGVYKPNAVQDFQACVDYLVKERFTRSGRLALLGDGPGAILTGALATRSPRLAKAIVARNGLFDMLRAEQAPNGELGVPEFGTTGDQAQFEVLLSYSPYHNIDGKGDYPAAFLITGRKEPMVAPFHTYKMAARLEAAAPSKPIYVKVNPDAAAGDRLPYLAQLKEQTEIMAFLFDQLGVSFKE